MPSISYAITVCNEHEELDRLLSQLDESIRDKDEIIVQLDTTATQEVRDVLSRHIFIESIEYPLNKDFASFKNNLNKYCNKDYIFQIDADEYPNPELINCLPSILEHNPEIDVFLVPRINTVEGLTEEHIQKWGWNVQNNRINFPDYQWRIWKNNKKIKWINKVHERLDGFDIYTVLPEIEELCLYHPKDIKRQEKQNQLYSTL